MSRACPSPVQRGPLSVRLVSRCQRLRHCTRQLIAMLLVLGLVTHAFSLEVVNLQLRWYHQFQFAGYYAAEQMGYYTDAGLDVRIHAASPGLNATRQVLEGKADFGVDNSGVLYARMQGMPTVVLAALFQHSPSVLLTRAQSHILSPHQLAGRKVMITDPLAEADLLAMIIREGVPLEKVEIITSSFNLGDLVSGQVDAYHAYLTNEPFSLGQRGVDYHVLNPRTYGVDFYSDFLFTSEEMLRQRPDTVERFRNASLRGWKYAMANPDQVIDWLQQVYGVEKTREHLAFEAEAMRALIMPELIPIGHINPGRIQYMAQTFVEAGLSDGEFDLDGFLFTGPNLLAERMERYRQQFALMWGIIGLLLLLATALVLLLRRMKLITQRLERSEEQYRLLAENATDVIWVMDMQGKFTYISPSVFQLRGYTPDEVMAQSFDEVVCAGSREVVLRGLMLANELAASGQERHPVYEYVEQPCRDGSTVWTEVLAHLMYDANAKAVGILGVSRDITQRKRTEDNLRKLSLAVEQAPVSIIITNAVGQIEYVNPKFEEVTGFSASDVLGRNPRILQSQSHPDTFYRQMWQTIASGSQWSGEIRNRRKNGELYWEQATISSIRDGKGAITHYVGIKEDITIRKAHEQMQQNFRQELALQVEVEVARNLESQKQFQVLFEQNPEGILILNDDGAFVKCNPAAARMLEYEPDEMIGTLIWSLQSVRAPLSPLQAAGLARPVHAAEPARFEWLLVARSGREVLVDVQMVPFHYDGKPQLLCIWRDITELKQLQQERDLQQAIVVQQAKMAELGSMMGAIVHQWHQPLNNVSLLIQDMQDRYHSDELDADILDETVERILKQFQFMSRTLDDFRNFFKPSRQVESFSIVQCVEEVVDLMKPQLQKQGLRVEIGGDRGVKVMGYASEFKQVILNLLSNARDAHGVHGTNDPYVNIQLEWSRGKPVLLFSDNAGGIHPDLLPEKLFQPFTSTRGEHGTGIGLSLSRLIMKKMGGTLRVTSNAPGACFRIEFPEEGGVVTEGFQETEHG